MRLQTQAPVQPHLDPRRHLPAPQERVQSIPDMVAEVVEKWGEIERWCEVDDDPRRAERTPQ